MTIRTSKKTVKFTRPFVLDGFDAEELPSGTYIVETDEELLEGISFNAYRRVLTLLHPPPNSGRRGRTEILTVDPHELEAALERDRMPSDALAALNARQEAVARTAKARQEEVNNQALDRAENEGMALHSRQ